MVNSFLHIQAIELRKQGKSYSQIKQVLGLSKSTLSGWLKDMPLSRKEIDALLWHNEKRIEKCRNTKLQHKEEKNKQEYEYASKNILPLSDRELLIAGLFLYWGEGGKTNEAQTVISNIDPKLVQFAVYWLMKCFHIRKDKFKAKLHIYSDMDEEKSISYWMNILGFERTQFNKTYIKKTRIRNLSYKGFGYGTCNVYIGSVDVKRKIMMGIKAIADNYFKSAIIS